MKWIPRFVRENPEFRIVDFLGENPRIPFSKDEIRKNAGLSKSAFTKAWRELQNYRAVKGKGLFMLNKKNALARSMWGVLLACGKMAGRR